MIIDLVTDPEEVERLAEEIEDENWEFREWVKRELDLSDEELMSIVRELAEEITARIDCTRCANCCKTATGLDEEDVERLAGALGVSVAELQETTLEYEEDRGGYWRLPAPCPLLDGKLCRVYEARPTLCREYPHLHNDFRSCSMARINSTFVCPIVFNVVEGMKRALRWRG